MLGHPNKMIRDTSKYRPLMRPGGPGRKPKPKALRHLAYEQLGLGIQSGEHSPVEDARAALYLYQLHAKVGQCQLAPTSCHLRFLDSKHTIQKMYSMSREPASKF